MFERVRFRLIGYVIVVTTIVREMMMITNTDNTIFHGMSLRDSLRNTFSPTYSLDATISPTWKKMSVSAIDAATFTVCCVNSCDAFERLCMAK